MYQQRLIKKGPVVLIKADLGRIDRAMLEDDRERGEFTVVSLAVSRLFSTRYLPTSGFGSPQLIRGLYTEWRQPHLVLPLLMYSGVELPHLALHQDIHGAHERQV